MSTLERSAALVITDALDTLGFVKHATIDSAGAVHLRYDIDDCGAKEQSAEYSDLAEALLLVGLGITDPQIEHDCITGEVEAYLPLIVVSVLTKLQASPLRHAITAHGVNGAALWQPHDPAIELLSIGDQFKAYEEAYEKVEAELQLLGLMISHPKINGDGVGGLVVPHITNTPAPEPISLADDNRFWLLTVQWTHNSGKVNTETAICEGSIVQWLLAKSPKDHYVLLNQHEITPQEYAALHTRIFA
jgi:hypothetical protein